MGDRALAHVEKVVSTYAIEGADKIEMTQVLDFHVVTKKGEFKPGDLAVYVEIDSIMPDGLEPALQAKYDEIRKKHRKATGEDIQKLQSEMDEILTHNTRPEFEFLRQKKFRIKAIKYNSFGGIVSMGILFPLSILPVDSVITEGADFTEALGITKVVEDAEEVNKDEVKFTQKKSKLEKMLDHHFQRYALYRKIKSGVKGFERSGKWDTSWMASQTDEENVQKLFTKTKERYGDDNGWYVTSKIEGQSMSAYNHITSLYFGLSTRNDFAVCSRGRHLISDDGSRFWQTARELDLEKRLKATGLNIFCQGEHAGGRIQGNIYKLKEHHWYLFNVWDITKKRRYNFDEFFEFCHKFGFEHAPLIDSNFALPETVQDMLDYSNGTDELVPGVKVAREGVVIRRKDDTAVSFKVRSPEYIILHGK